VKGPYSDPGHSNLCVTKSVKHLVTHKLQCLPRVLELHVQRHSPEPSVVERGHSRVTHTHAHTGMCASSAGHSKVTHTQSHTHTPGVFACVCVCVCVCVRVCVCVYVCSDPANFWWKRYFLINQRKKGTDRRHCQPLKSDGAV